MSPKYHRASYILRIPSWLAFARTPANKKTTMPAESARRPGTEVPFGAAGDSRDSQKHLLVQKQWTQDAEDFIVRLLLLDPDNANRGFSRCVSFAQKMFQMTKKRGGREESRVEIGSMVIRTHPVFIPGR